MSLSENKMDKQKKPCFKEFTLESNTKLLLLLLLYTLLASSTFTSFSRHDPFFSYPQVDEQSNLFLAKGFLDQGLSASTFWQEPLTFFYYASFQKAGIDSPEFIKFFHLFILNPLIIFILYRWSLLVLKRKALLATTLYAFSPLPIFLSLTLMKTLPSILLVLLTLHCFTLFYLKPDRKRLGFALVVFWFLSWMICQHLLLFLPILLLAAARRVDKKSREGVRNLLTISISAIILFISAISLSSWMTRTPLLTLTINGKINLHLANNQNVAETMTIWPGPEWEYYFYLLQPENNATPSMESGIVLDLPNSPAKWLSLYAKKIFWEFTPHAYFRQFSWNEARRISPWMAIYPPLTILFLLLIFLATLNWFRQGILVRSLIACWWVYHLVNIIFIPGIARYNAVIWPLTALLAVTGLKRISLKPRHLLIIPCLGLWFSHPPNDFQDEYIRFRKMKLSVSNEIPVTVEIPHNTSHIADYRFLKAKSLSLKNECAKAEALLKQTPDWNHHGPHYTNLLAYCLNRQHLYMDLIDSARLCGRPQEDISYFEQMAVVHIEKMLRAYQSSGRLDQQKFLQIETLIRSRLAEYPHNQALKKALKSLEEFRSRNRFHGNPEVIENNNTVKQNSPR